MGTANTVRLENMGTILARLYRTRVQTRSSIGEMVTPYPSTLAVVLQHATLDPNKSNKLNYSSLQTVQKVEIL
jgi:hypothetical protein